MIRRYFPRVTFNHLLRFPDEPRFRSIVYAHGSRSLLTEGESTFERGVIDNESEPNDGEPRRVSPASGDERGPTGYAFSGSPPEGLEPDPDYPDLPAFLRRTAQS